MTKQDSNEESVAASHTSDEESDTTTDTSTTHLKKIFSAIENNDVLRLICLLNNFSSDSSKLKVSTNTRRLWNEAWRPKGLTILHVAAVASQSSHIMMNEILRRKIIDVNAINDDGENALLYLIKKDVDALTSRSRVLLDAGIDVNAADHNGTTALMLVQKQQPVTTLLIFLLQFGADPNTRLLSDCEENIPSVRSRPLLHWAIEQNIQRLLQSLLYDYPANLEATDAKGNTALHVAAMKSRRDPTVFYQLIKADSNVLVANHMGVTPLMILCSNQFVKAEQNLKCIQALLEKISSVNELHSYINSVDNLGTSALMYAAKYFAFSIIKLLVDMGGNQHVIDKRGNSLLHVILKRKHLCATDLLPSTVGGLLALGVNPNVTDSLGVTALHCIVYDPAHNDAQYDYKERCIRVKTMSILLQNGASTMLADDAKRLPIDIACRSECASTIFILLKEMAASGAIAS